MAQAFYRTYRSKSLQEVVGQDHITTTLEFALKKGKINHAYLFTGPKGVGKTSVARILAHEVNKLPYDESRQHLDIIEIDAASNRRIDDIRDLREKVHIAPVSAAYKVYIIDEVHMLTGESFNALLKTLEEPPAHVIFIMATTEAHKVPATILSRVQRFHFRPISRQAAVKHLKEIAKKEGIAITDEALDVIAERGDGSFRDSISLLDQLASMNDMTIDADFVESMLGLAPETALKAIIDRAESGDAASVSKQLQSFEEQGVSAAVISEQLISRIMHNTAINQEQTRLIDELLLVSKSQQPAVKLHISLLKYLYSIQPVKPVKPKKPAAPAAAVTSFELKRAAPKDIESFPADVTEPAVDGLSQLEEESRQLDGRKFSDGDWHTVLNVIKKSNPPIYSVLKRASISVVNDVLKLTFSFKLHQKKMDDQKYRSKLISAITSLGISCPRIETAVGQEAVVDFLPEPATAASPADETAASVLAMMGGGDVLDAKN